MKKLVHPTRLLHRASPFISHLRQYFFWDFLTFSTRIEPFGSEHGISISSTVSGGFEQVDAKSFVTGNIILSLTFPITVLNDFANRTGFQNLWWVQLFQFFRFQITMRTESNCFVTHLQFVWWFENFSSQFFQFRKNTKCLPTGWTFLLLVSVS